MKNDTKFAKWLNENLEDIIQEARNRFESKEEARLEDLEETIRKGQARFEPEPKGLAFDVTFEKVCLFFAGLFIGVGVGLLF